MENKTEDVLDKDEEYIRNDANDKEYFQLSLQKNFWRRWKLNILYFKLEYINF